MRMKTGALLKRRHLDKLRIIHAQTKQRDRIERATTSDEAVRTLAGSREGRQRFEHHQKMLHPLLVSRVEREHRCVISLQV